MENARPKRGHLPFFAPDMSALARALRRQWPAASGLPSHVEMLNILARSVGFRNLQHYSSAHKALASTQGAALAAAADSAPAEVEHVEQIVAKPSHDPTDKVRVEKLARHFDADGRLERWPSKLNLQRPCLWALWWRLPQQGQFSEREISELLKNLHGFGDHALLRRELVNNRLLGRMHDGSAYWRIEQSPPTEALALIQYLAASQPWVQGKGVQRVSKTRVTLSKA